MEESTWVERSRMGVRRRSYLRLAEVSDTHTAIVGYIYTP